MKKYINIYTTIIIMFFTVAITSCGSKSEEIKQQEKVIEETNRVELTNEQIKNKGNMVF